ncbi:MAG TPA: HIT domain-containing protein [Thermoanaerobaculia bacterium]|nr:HIT domain-containing protein [Thermoanaerobaculia bacterium]
MAEPDAPERLVVHHTAHHVVLLNRHPYTNGHLMIAPREHVAWPGQESAEAQAALWPMVLLCLEALRRAYSPDGFNLGMNLGSFAGAGLPGHAHFHVVPRWGGDTNFMGVVAQTRLVPQALEETRQLLRPIFTELARCGAG